MRFHRDWDWGVKIRGLKMKIMPKDCTFKNFKGRFFLDLKFKKMCRDWIVTGLEYKIYRIFSIFLIK